jgi:hypothetical protein
VVLVGSRRFLGCLSCPKGFDPHSVGQLDLYPDSFELLDPDPDVEIALEFEIRYIL